MLAVCGVLSAVPGAQAAGLQDLPGQELWQPYLNAAPQDADSFVHDPVGALLSLLPASPLEMIRQMAHCYADVLLFLLLIAAGIVGSLTAAGGECEEHDGRQQEGGKGSELHGGGFLSCDEVGFSKTGESCFFRVFALPMQTKNKAVNAL